MNFTISTEKLKNAISFLEPFVLRQKKEDDWYTVLDDEDTEINIEHPYLDDKITFEFLERRINLYIQHNKFIKTTISLDYESNSKNEEGTKFALQFDYLKQEINKCNCEKLSFKEIPFFGFQVYEIENNRHLFDIIAYSVFWQEAFYPKRFFVLYPKSLSIEKKTLLLGLGSLDYSKQGKIEFFIKDNSCTIIAQTNKCFRYKKVRTNEINENYFSVPSKYAKRISDVISHWTQNVLQVSYNDEHCGIYNYNGYYGVGENLEWSIRKKELPDLSFLRNATVDLDVSIAKKDLCSYLHKRKIVESRFDIVMHFTKNHVNLYSRDEDFEIAVYEFIDTSEFDKDITTAVDVKTFELLISEITSDIVHLSILDGLYMTILNPYEFIGGKSFQVLRLEDMNKTNEETLGIGDQEITKHPNYKIKYS